VAQGKEAKERESLRLSLYLAIKDKTVAKES
jgi:hypothetical protein